MPGVTFDKSCSVSTIYIVYMTVTVLIDIHTVSEVFIKKGSKCHYSVPHLVQCVIEG